MARFSHTVTVAALGRGWLEEAAGGAGGREAVESAAREWNTTIAELTPLHGEALRAEIADALTEPGELTEPAEPKTL
ncbi:hypothetical protein CIB93_02210 [Streptomyces sp. WZ.A104]|uniref:hypothetical protein n=1 Tax=Streptomyces sp. WZ.A104 TaxID=2023771 RepID=UPI000BBB7AFD|nr:hypothetical protein [Streptomyces sp. WZ.A104]PCG87535.1 hypothetical protein CIB93_02210 [Streptomyces sp. WZ.A104]